MRNITPHLDIHEGVVNVGILRDGDRALLIDYGDGSVSSALEELDVSDVGRILFTHHHRDQAYGLIAGAQRAAKVSVPAHERPWFDGVETYWNDPKRRWHLYDDRPQAPVITKSIPIDDELRDGDEFRWGAAQLTVVSTPGHTDGSVSYVIEVDDRLIAFTGDMIYAAGQVWDAHSLQKGEQRLTDYHGFLGARHELIDSLKRVRNLNPDLIVPSHGAVIDDPRAAINLLLERLDGCYDRYVAASALRFYFPAMFEAFQGKPDHMPLTRARDVPPFLKHIGTTWMVISDNREAFVMDCGAQRVIEEIDKSIEAGEISDVTGLWITHYHDDHVDAIPDFQRRFDCPTRADAIVADVVTRPAAYRIPAVSPEVARVDRATRDGESWQWNEFKMTAYFFPGQTHYHGGLLVEGQGVRLFFTGDSFTPGGMDDYCAANRNLLGEGVGYDRCLALLKEVRPTLLFNCHVDVAFSFTDDEIDFMRDNLRERERLFGELVPWDHPNYGLDPHWVRCDPYEQCATPEQLVTVCVEITNHSDEAREAFCEPMAPEGWLSTPARAVVHIPPRSVGVAAFRLSVAETAAPTRTPIPFDLTYHRRRLGPIREAVIDLRGSAR